MSASSEPNVEDAQADQPSQITSSLQNSEHVIDASANSLTSSPEIHNALEQPGGARERAELFDPVDEVMDTPRVYRDEEGYPTIFLGIRDLVRECSHYNSWDAKGLLKFAHDLDSYSKRDQQWFTLHRDFTNLWLDVLEAHVKATIPIQGELLRKIRGCKFAAKNVELEGAFGQPIPRVDADVAGLHIMAGDSADIKTAKSNLVAEIKGHLARALGHLEAVMSPLGEPPHITDNTETDEDVTERQAPTASNKSVAASASADVVPPPIMVSEATQCEVTADISDAPTSIKVTAGPIMVSQSTQTEEQSSSTTHIQASTSTNVIPGRIMVSQATQTKDTAEAMVDYKELEAKSESGAEDLTHYSQLTDLLAFSLANEDNPAALPGPLQDISDSLNEAVNETLDYDDMSIAPHSVSDLHAEMKALSQARHTHTLVTTERKHLPKQTFDNSLIKFDSVTQLQHCIAIFKTHVEALNILGENISRAQEHKHVLGEFAVKEEWDLHLTVGLSLKEWGWQINAKWELEAYVPRERGVS